MRMLCVKGIAKDHAKFSPVGEPNSLYPLSDVPGFSEGGDGYTLPFFL